MKKKFAALVVAAVLGIGLFVSMAPASGSSSQPIQAIRCETPYGARYTRYVWSFTWRAECRYGDTMVGVQFGF